jgi:plastocyanin
MTPQLSRRDALRATAGAAAATLAGCLSLSDALTEEDTPEPEPENAGELGVPTREATVEVTSRPFPKFKPQVIHVEPGATVEWVVETGRHDVTAYHRDIHPPHRTTAEVEPWGSDLLTGPGSTHEYTFETEGVYDYVDTQQVCVSHEVAGNVGRVVVGWPDSEGEPAMADPQEELPDRVGRAFAQFNERTRPVLDAGPD